MFGLENYKTLLDSFLSQGMVFTTSWENESSPETLLLRHDVDFSVELAHQLAEAEAEAGVASTFFFLVTSNMYNLLSRENQRFVSSIADMGHKISIHFDPAAHDDLNRFQDEKVLFDGVFGTKVDIASIHRPGPFLENNNGSLGGVPHTYNDAFFGNMRYISDSGGKNPSPQINSYLAEPRSQGLQLLIHPIWWTQQGYDVTETLNSWQTGFANFIKSEVRRNCLTYDD